MGGGGGDKRRGRGTRGGWWEDSPGGAEGGEMGRPRRHQGEEGGLAFNIRYDNFRPLSVTLRLPPWILKLGILKSSGQSQTRPK